MITVENLPDEMLKYRAKHNVTIKKMAELCQVSTQTICSVENRLQTPGRLTLAKIKLVLEDEGGTE